jgi:serine/threonine protein kinase
VQVLPDAPADFVVYRAPELLELGGVSGAAGSTSSPASDAWAMAAILVHMLSGKQPFEGLQVGGPPLLLARRGRLHCWHVWPDRLVAHAWRSDRAPGMTHLMGSDSPAP